MKSMLLQLILVLFITGYSPLIAQECKVLNRVQPDGSMFYYMEAEKFYETKEKKLHGAVATDGETYYLFLIPSPTPPKKDTKKIAGDLTVKLQDGSSQILEHFDSQYINQDTTLAIFYTIGKNQVQEFLDKPVQQVSLDFAEGKKESYNFSLHKEKIQEQLHCFIDRRNKIR